MVLGRAASALLVGALLIGPGGASVRADDVSAAAPSVSARALDPVRLDALVTAAGEWNRFRILALHARYDVSRLQVDGDGVRVGITQRRAAIARPEGYEPGVPINVTWADIERIDGTRSKAGKGLAEGVIIGGILGLSATALFWKEQPAGEYDYGSLGFFPLGLLVGGVAGATLGGTTGWHRLYP